MNKLILLLISIISVFYAQKTADIRGLISDEATGEPMLFTNVIIVGTDMGTSTDDQGIFYFSKLPLGKYTLKISTVGYEEITEEVELKVAEKIYTLKLEMKEGKTLDEFVVDAESEEKKNKVQISAIKVTAEDIKMVPTLGGEADLASYIQTMPGVVVTGDQGGQFYVRGGAPIQNKVMLDGMTIYNPFHSIGFFSVFDTDIIKTADIYTGGYAANYGGRISSIMDITTKDGNKKHFSGTLSASTFMARAMLEGPLKKATEDNPTTVTYLFSGKYSYFDQTSKTLYKDLVEDGLPYQLRDYYGKVSIGGGNGSKINFFGFSYNDRVNYEGISDLGWNSFGLGTNFLVIPAGSSTKMEGHFAYSDYNIAFEEQNISARESAIGGFEFGFDFSNYIKQNEVKYGLGGTGFSTDLVYENEVGNKLEQQQNTTEFYGYFLYKIKANKVIIEPSLRMQYYGSVSVLSPEPRLGLKWNISNDFRFKAAAGIYTQNLVAINSDRDIVNLFYGFATSPDNIQDEQLTIRGKEKEVNNGLQRANHVIAGFEYDFNKNLSFNVEGYYKYFPQLVNVNRNKIYPDDAGNADKPDELKKDFIIESGNAYGVDITANYRNKRFNLNLVYSLGKTVRFDGIQEYAPVFDRRHNINFIGSYKFGNDNSWQIDVRWNFGSGLPFTPTQGFYGQEQMLGGVSTDYTSSNNVLGIYYGEINSKRLFDYHRLDFNVKKKFKTGERSYLEVVLSLTNAYNRQNIFYIERYTNETIYQLPILPALGASWKF